MYKLNSDKINNEIIEFVKNSPTAFHATEELEKRLIEGGYKYLSEGDEWKLEKGGKYFVTRNGSSLIAFKMGQSSISEVGVRMAGGHTDSPSFRVKPNPEMNNKGYFQLAVEPYGGMLIGTWFDRDLSIAGRISYLTTEGDVTSCLLNFDRAIAVIPSLAIHLNREANNGYKFNKQKDLPPLICQLEASEKLTFIQMIEEEMRRKGVASDCKKILDTEMFLYDTNTPKVIGYKNDYIASARIDNLYSCYLAVQGLIDSTDDIAALAVCNDHEECGSASTSGAGGTFLKDVLERMVGVGEDFSRAMYHSMLVSADNAHALHPNYMEKHDGNHTPIVNKGPVIKINSNQRYATNSQSAAIIISICEKNGLPYQKFVARSDMGCGSTLGPITATLLGVKTLDIGLPQLAMHSSRELVGTKDSFTLYQLLTHFYQEK